MFFGLTYYFRRQSHNNPSYVCYLGHVPTVMRYGGHTFAALSFPRISTCHLGGETAPGDLRVPSSERF